MVYKKEYITTFLNSRNWNYIRSGSLFDYYKPPKSLHLGSEYELEIAKDEAKPGFQNFTNSLTDVIFDLYGNEFTIEDLKTFFSCDETILSFRIDDDDTKNGSIQLERFSKAIDNLKLVFKQTVTFLSSEKPIFGQSKQQAELYIKNCRALQSEYGSYVTKVQLPAHTMLKTGQLSDSKEVPKKLYEVLDFTDNEILKNKVKVENIDKKYFQGHKDFINVELLSSIKDLCHQSNLNKFDFSFDSFNQSKVLTFDSVKSQMKYFNSYIRQLKVILLEETPLEFVGHVIKLSSNSPKNSDLNKIVIEGEISNNKERVEVVLNKADYEKAIEAHKEELSVRVTGIAKQLQSYYSINNPDIFEISNT
jgi:hypothetical protein